VHDGVTTLSAYDSFANVIVAPEGLEVNFDWLPLSQDAAGNKTGDDIARAGTVSNTAHIPDKVTTLSKSNFNLHLGVYGGADTSPVDDVFRSTNPDTRSSGVKVGTSGAVYPTINTNPFYPAVLANSTFSATAGYSAPAGANTANDVFAGSYTEYQKDAVEPDADYRYIIQNDLKWCYATSPFATPLGAAASTGQGETYNVPKATAYTASYDGYSKSGDGFGVLIDNIESQAGGGYGTTATIPQNAVGSVNSTPPTLVTYNLASGTGSIKANSSIYASNQASTAFTWRTTTTNSSQGHDMVVTTNTTTDTVAGSTTEVYLSGTGGTTGYKYAVTRSPDDADTDSYLVNRVGAMMKKANTVTFHTMITALWHHSTDDTYGAAYEDPNEPSGTAPNIKTDAQFESDVDTMYALIHGSGTGGAALGANTYHQSITSGGSRIANSTFTSSSHTYDNTTYNAWLSGIADFQTDMELRITEISNRIGYLNGKGSQTGGIADGGSGAQSAGHSTTNGGFAGTDFNGGKGYANTIYSHANFLAGKKINLLGKVLKAIVAVQAMYDSITRKRSEYYEYNQAE
jgi:hypothetical protein